MKAVSYINHLIQKTPMHGIEETKRQFLSKVDRLEHEEFEKGTELGSAAETAQMAIDKFFAENQMGAPDIEATLNEHMKTTYYNTLEKPGPFDPVTLRNIEAVEKMSRHPLSHEQLSEQIARNHRPAMLMDREGEVS